MANTNILIIPLFCLFLTLRWSSGVTSDGIPMTTNCEFYNYTACPDEKNGTCVRTETCDSSEYKRNHCYVVWKINETGQAHITLKGCFLYNEQCHNQTSCIDRSPNVKNKHKFCCCVGDMCNRNFSWEPAPITETQPSSTPIPMEESSDTYLIVAGCIILIICVVMGIMVCWWNKKKFYFNELPTTDPHPLPPPSPFLDQRPIQLIEIKARGRFGAVWKAQFKSEEVAVKIFPVQDKQSWLAEQEIFKIPNIKHPNILEYIGVEKHADNVKAEFWLITAYHEKGSLCDYLKGHTLSWNDVSLVVETMSKGLMHLHEVVPGMSSKPPIAHRDFKSKNVLLKSNMSACIADFGLALVFESGKSCGNTHGQVGTRRYMAPEVLEGAIDFRPDAFLRIDMYACGLVLWELVSRCTAQDGPIGEYRLPFEEEVGSHPTLEDMQESVVQKKVRPVIQQHWKQHSGLAMLCDTIEELWDHDAEARLSASCIVERLTLHKKNIASYGLRIENDTLSSPIKENSL